MEWFEWKHHSFLLIISLHSRWWNCSKFFGVWIAETKTGTYIYHPKARPLPKQNHCHDVGSNMLRFQSCTARKLRLMKGNLWETASVKCQRKKLEVCWRMMAPLHLQVAMLVASFVACLCFVLVLALLGGAGAGFIMSVLARCQAASFFLCVCVFLLERWSVPGEPVTSW